MIRIKLIVFFAGLFAVLGARAAERPGIILDPAFDAGELEPNSFIQGFSALPDGKILIWGSFTNVQGSARSGVALLESDGRLAESFNPRIEGIHTSTEVLSVGPVGRQGDGKFVVAVRVVGGNGEIRNRLARLHHDGSEDTAFTAAVGPNDVIQKVALLPNGKILVAGDFMNVNGMALPELVRLNPDGSRDEAFIHKLSIEAWRVFLQGDGSAVFFEGLEYVDGGEIVRITVLDAEGNSSRQFTTSPLPVHIDRLVRQSDGKFLVITRVSGGGHFGFSVQDSLLRLNADGSIDRTFDTGLGPGPHVESNLISYSSVAEIDDIAFQPDGKIWIGGTFDTYDGAARTNLARLNADGSLDMSFDPGEGTDGSVSEILIPGDGKLLLRGGFHGISGFQRPGLARVFINGTRTPGVRFGKTPLIVEESQGSAESTVLRYGDAREALTVDYRMITRNAVGAEETLGRGSVSFRPTESEQTLSIPVVDNPFPEEDRQIELRFEDRADLNFPKPSSLTLMILDDERPGSIDPTFKSEIKVSPFAQEIFSAAIQSDGRITVAGVFGSDGRSRIVRLEQDGRIAKDFNPVFDSTTYVHTIALQPDGRVLAYVSDSNSGRIVRLEADGSLDGGFATSLQVGNITSLLVQSDGKVLVCGNLDTAMNTWTGRVVRLQSDGKIDPSFENRLAGSSLSALAIQPDGKILVAGLLEPERPGEYRNLVRLHPDGRVDSSFSPSAQLVGYISVILLQPDNRILIAGNNLVDEADCIVRLNADGSLDGTFKPSFADYSSVHNMARDGEGRILIAGNLHLDSGQYSMPLLRLYPNGTIDPSFRANLPPFTYFAGPKLLAVQNDGKVLVVAPSVSGDQASWRWLSRLNSDPPLRLESVPVIQRAGSGRATITVRTLPGRDYILQASSDLAAWFEVRYFTATKYSETLEDPGTVGTKYRFYRAIQRK